MSRLSSFALLTRIVVAAVALPAAMLALPTCAAPTTVGWGFDPTPTTAKILVNESITSSGGGSIFSSHPLIETDATFTVTGATLPAGGTSLAKTVPAAGVFYFTCGVHGSSMPTTVLVCAASTLPLKAFNVDGSVEALTDSLLVVRYLLGLCEPQHRSDSSVSRDEHEPGE